MAQTPTMTDEPLYDRAVILSTTSPLDVVFFANPKSTTDPNKTTITKSFADTNMTQQGGRIGGQQSFDIDSIAIQPDLATLQTDSEKLAKDAWVEIRLDNDQITVWRCPARLVTSGSGIFSQGGPTSSNSGALGFPSPSAIIRFKYLIRVDAGESFSVHYQFASTPSLSADCKLSVTLWGTRYMVPVADAVANAPRRA